MYSIGASLMFFDLDNIMSFQDFQPDADKSSTFKIYGFNSTSPSGDPQPTLLNDGVLSPQRSDSEWNLAEPYLFEPFFVCDATPLHQLIPSGDAPYPSGKAEGAPLRTWSASCSSEPLMYLENGVPMVSASSSPTPTDSSTYSHEDASPSPLQLNEFSNVFDFGFSTSMPNDYLVSEPKPASLPSSISRRRSPRPPRNVRSPDSHKSREPSPTNSNGDAKRRFPCLIPGCTRRFTSQYTLKVHMEAHKPKPRVSFPCTLGCSERFSRQHDRLRHEVAKHGKVCEFLCDDCGRFFSSSKTLGNHKCPVAQGGTRWVNSCS